MDTFNINNLPKEYTIAPFWFWNDDLNEKHLEFQLKEMLDKGVFEFIIHGRLGLSVPYLSEEWFSKVDFVIRKSKELGLRFWIYDEENWPSGYAGGKVLKDDLSYCGKFLKKNEVTVAYYLNNKDSILKSTIEGLNTKVVCAQLLVGNNRVDITDRAFDVDYLSTLDNDTKLLLFVMNYTLWNPAYSEDYFIDVLNPNATISFMKHTHAEYEKRYSEEFGKTIKGFFTDEAGFYNNLKIMPSNIDDEDSIVWTDGFEEYFKERNGYCIKDCIHLLWKSQDTESTLVKRDYYETACEMYKKYFLEPQRKFCEKYDMKFIGHLHMEDYLHMQIITQGNMVAALESLSYAGTDRIDLNCEKINEKFISSIGHAWGKERVMSETYAVSGWGLTLQEMKRWVDWQYVRGINMMVPHAFYSSIEGKRKDECPPSEFFQNPYWKYFKTYAEYTNRLSYILSQGVHIADIALYYPMLSAYSKFKPDDWQDVIKFDIFLQQVANSLLENQYDFDFIFDEVLENAQCKDGSIKISNESYKVIIVPGTDIISSKIFRKFEEFVFNGGILAFLGEIPKTSDEKVNQRSFTEKVSDLLSNPNVYYYPKNIITKAYTYAFNPFCFNDFIDSKIGRDFKLLKSDHFIKYVHRKINDKEYYFIINEENFPKSNKCFVRGLYFVEEINIGTGEQKIVNFKQNCEITETDLKFDPYGSKLLCFTKNENERLNNIKEIDETFKYDVISLTGDWIIEINGSTQTGELKSWDEYGAGDYSGDGTYYKEFNIERNIENWDCELRLGDVWDCADVKINGKSIGHRIWEPYSFNISKMLVIGKNDIEITVCNTLINQLEKIPQKSGLAGPVKIVCKKNP